MSKHTMTAFCPFGLQPDALEVQIAFKFIPGRPAVMYLRNGDPGYPADPAEVDFASVKMVDREIDAAMQKMLDEWAIEYLESDEGFQEAIEAVSGDDRDEALDRAESRADR